MILTDFTQQDFIELYDFMRPIWFETYTNVIPLEQIEFLLDKYFDPKNVQNFIKQGYSYKKVDGVGVLIYQERDNDVFIDKLYLPSKFRGMGYPEKVFDELLKLNKDLTLNVNQANKRAVACYLKNGFSIEVTHDVDLGNGMINKDYIMRKKVIK